MTETPPPTDSGATPTPKPVVPSTPAPPAPTPPPAPKPAPSPASSPAPSTPAARPAPNLAAAPGQAKPAEKPAATTQRRSAGPVLTVIGMALLALGLAWVWTQQQNFAASFDPNRLTVLETQVASLRVRVSRLEQQQPAPAPAPVDLRPLEARLTALEQRPAAAPAVESPAMEAQLNALQQRVAQAEQAQAGTAARAAKLARLQAATAALAAGRPLGAIPDAPAALTRFATVPPPTEAALRLDFDAAAARAAEASRPATEADSLAERMWLQIQSLVTVRDGDRVLSGAPATVVLGAAREQLAAGNLAGAVADVERLDKAAADAMADWHDRARALLDARAALAKLSAAD